MARQHLIIPDGRAADTRQLGSLLDFGHLPDRLQEVAEPFSVCARAVIEAVPDGFLLSNSLHSLIEAKDAAVRARVLADREATGTDPGAAVVGRYTRDGAVASVDVPGLLSPAQALGYEGSASDVPVTVPTGRVDATGRPELLDRPPVGGDGGGV